MNQGFVEWDAWLLDVFLVSTVLLTIGIAIQTALRQPARRIALARSVVVGLAILAALAAAPAWPRIGAVGRQSNNSVPTGGGSPLPSGIDSFSGSALHSEMSEPTRRRTGTTAGILRSPTLLSSSTIHMLVPSQPSWRESLWAAFAVGGALNLAWLAFGAIQAFRLRGSARVADIRIHRLMAHVAGDRQQEARVLVSEAIGLPVAIGVFRPTIVLPANFVTTEPDDCLEVALAHEWAHIRNGDLRWLALLRVLNIMFYAQPLFWLLRRAIRTDQELLADAAASTLHGDGRLAYAETLIGWARSSYRPHPGALASAALALWERPSMLHRRVRLLLDRDYCVEEAASRRWKLATACAGLLATLLLSMVTLRPSAATAQEMTEALQVTHNPAADASRTVTTTGDRFEYAGRVLDPDGKPFAGAKLHLAYFGYSGQYPPAVRAMSDSSGRFRIEMRKQDFVDTTNETPWTTTQVVATADGFGFGWADAGEWADANASEKKKFDSRDLTIGLRQDDAPVYGRILDLEGRPVSGVTISLAEILESEDGDLSAFVAASTNGQGGSHEIEREYLKRKLWPRASGLPLTILTDSDGRFSIRGVGGERLLRLVISGPTVQTKKINVLTMSLSPFQVTAARGSPDWGITLYYGANFTHVAAPTKPVYGVVKDKDTGTPLAGVRIACNKTAEFPILGVNGVETTTDEQGRYRLVGLPKGRGNQVIAIPASGQPYHAACLELPDTPGLNPVLLDVQLKRGVVVEGRVFDRNTKEPLAAFVEYHAYLDNPNLADAVGFDRAHYSGRCKTEPDGSYRLIGMLGHGLVAAVYIGGTKEYLKGTGVPGGNLPGSILPIVPNGMMWEFNVLSEVNLPRKVTTHHIDLALETGVTRTVRVVDVEGRVLTGARIKLQPHVMDLTPPQQTAEFSVEALRPDEVRPLLAFHEERKLAGKVELKANEPRITEVKLQPWATLRGRLVDGGGEARPGMAIEQLDRPAKPVTTDSLGHFLIEGLVPGKLVDVWVSPNAGYMSGTVARGLVLKPGEVRDLGDVQEKQ